MKLTPLSTIALLIAGLHLNTASAAEFLAPQANDIHTKSSKELIAAPVAVGSFGISDVAVDPAEVKRLREPVSVSWPMRQEVKSQDAPFVSESRESYRKVTGAQLNAGVDMHTSSPRALVRLQALGETGQREKDALHPKYLQIKTKAGKTLVNGDGMESIVTADKMAKADLPFASGTSAFRVHPNLGSGSMQLQAQGLDDSQEYLVNVVEADSPYVLSLQANAHNYLHGHDLVVTAAISGLGKKHAMKTVQAELVSPTGRVFPVNFKAQAGNDYRAKLKLDANEVPTPGLWEVRMHLDTMVGTQVVQRSARTSFAVALPVARLDGSVQMLEGNGSLAMKFGVETASSGRYEVRGMLYGTQNGKLVPLGIAQTANWLEAGKGDIALNFDAALLQNATAPFEVREVNLLDQGRFAMLHKQARGVVVSEADWRKFSQAKTASFAPNAGVHVFQEPVAKKK